MSDLCMPHAREWHPGPPADRRVEVARVLDVVADSALGQLSGHTRGC